MKCVCMRSMRPCRCASPVQKCLVLGCYQPGVEQHPEVSEWKWCGPHGRMELKIRQAREECAAELRAIEAAAL